jgi:hypothetical protein
MGIVATFVVFGLVGEPGEARGDSYTYTAINVAGSLGTFAEGVNNVGQVAGYYTGGNGITGYTVDGFVESGGVYTTLDIPQSIATQAYGINDSGTVVGYYQESGSGGIYAFVESGGVYTTLVPPGPNDLYMIAIGINNSGEVLCYSEANTGPNQYYVESQGVYTPINFPGATSTVATGINNLGQVVGYYNNNQSFIESGGVYTSIFTEFPGSGLNYAAGINDSGQIIGFNVEGNPAQGGNPPGAFVYNDGVFTTLLDPEEEGNSTIPQTINDLGQIVGYYSTNPNAYGYSGFLAVPSAVVPEPSALVMAGTSIIAGLAYSRRRRRDA